MSTVTIVLTRTLLAAIACVFLAIEARAVSFVTIDFSGFHNFRLQNLNAAFPEGNVVLGGVPFDIPVGGNNAWCHTNCGAAGGDGVQVLDIAVGEENITAVHMLINTMWGTTASGRMQIEFFGSDGAFAVFDLIGNDDIRDWNVYPAYTTIINGTTTTNVVNISPGQDGTPDVIDKQEFVLPVDFHDETLDLIRITDNRTTFVHSGTLFGITAEVVPELTIDIDIKPGSCPNSWNREGNGVLPVAILGTEDFDVTQIDVSSVTISRADRCWGGSVGPNEGPPGPHSVFEDVGTPFDGQECDCHEAGADGFLDLLLKFKTQDVADLLPVWNARNGSLVPLDVSGTLLDGTPFTTSSDCVRLVPPGSPPNLVSVQSAAGSWVDATPLDNNLDGGGFGSFERTYPHTTVLTLTAPSGHNGNPFIGWKLDGGELVQGREITFVVNNAEHTAKAVFKKTSGCGLGFELALLVPPLMWLYGGRRRRML